MGGVPLSDDDAVVVGAGVHWGCGLGSVADVLFETTEDGVTDGLTETYIRVYTDAPVTRGQIAPLRLTHLYRDGVWGEMI